jgi:hypothetical protein
MNGWVSVTFLRRPRNSQKAPPAAIFLSHIFLLKILPTGKCGTGKYPPGYLAQNFDAHRERITGWTLAEAVCYIALPNCANNQSIESQSNPVISNEAEVP